jgi:hypothetical protein
MLLLSAEHLVFQLERTAMRDGTQFNLRLYLLLLFAGSALYE